VYKTSQCPPLSIQKCKAISLKLFLNFPKRMLIKEKSLNIFAILSGVLLHLKKTKKSTLTNSLQRMMLPTKLQRLKLISRNPLLSQKSQRASQRLPNSVLLPLMKSLASVRVQQALSSKTLSKALIPVNSCQLTLIKNLLK